MLICAQIYTVYVALYQTSGLVGLTSTAVFACFISCLSMCASTQNRSTRKNLNTANVFFPLCFSRDVQQNSFFERVYKHLWQTDQVTLDQRIFLLMIPPMEERTKFLWTNETFCTSVSVTKFWWALELCELMVIVPCCYLPRSQVAEIPAGKHHTKVDLYWQAGSHLEKSPQSGQTAESHSRY